MTHWIWSEARQALERQDPALIPALSVVVCPPAWEDTTPLEHLVRSVCSQQLSVAGAKTVEARLAQACGGAISAEALSALGPEELRAVGLSRAKAKSIAAIAECDRKGQLKREDLSTLSDETVAARLIQLPGVGRWTAEMFLMFCLWRPDVLPAADLGLRYAIARLDGLLSEPVSPATALSRGEAWRPWRSAAVMALWAWRRT